MPQTKELVPIENSEIRLRIESLRTRAWHGMASHIIAEHSIAVHTIAEQSRTDG